MSVVFFACCGQIMTVNNSLMLYFAPTEIERLVQADWAPLQYKRGWTMKKQMFGTTLFAGLLLAGAAQAADMPLKAAPYAPPVYNWTGWYIGAHIGGAWSDNTFTLRDDDPSESSTEKGRHRSSVFGGGQIGYNFQSGSLLFGAE